jgi:hypothetical protein
VSLLGCRLLHLIARIKRPSVIFANQNSTYSRLSAGGSRFGHMRDGQRKKDQKCCVAHFCSNGANIPGRTFRRGA